ncbi:UDP-N-acetylmuramate--L-alanine ligase [Candidatus Kinetoplastidibacterium galati]|uniref:UDP-N-acetylmuramate--L-alanine ligase n=1 Tax=Candidatus Kinetoplastidibacterium galati TCC219 TaxID=1208921 RepID=M1LUQ7_9PROT|nr:UDP-N-acetylmuramate--L-alanine ligase [Candidatus Kinetoplastibacterium galatii]AGF49272.1 UDP-N-acetylmuramate--alanine ligase [Candidatus Kinetoplastibacterium galatii TCC219]
MKHRIKNIHFIGIGGSGMSGIATVLLNLGYCISGSDIRESEVIVQLRSMGAMINIGHKSSNVSSAEVVVVSTAINDNNPEILTARALNIPIVSRSIMLTELMRLKKGIAVAGTHGKTTTTSLIASVLGLGGLDPTFVIGGVLNSIGSNAALGKGDYIVVEADESDGSFLNLLPVMAVITNIDSDHMDTYGHDVSKLRAAFLEFTQRLPFYGSAFLCIDDANIREIMPYISRPITTYGLDVSANVKACNVRVNGMKMLFDVNRHYQDDNILKPISIELNLPGIHNIRNALAAVAIATELGISDDDICSSLNSFRGVGRRFSYIDDFYVLDKNGGGKFILIDDYGHHPREIEATILAARGVWPKRRIVLVFQPHRYTRTRDCFEDFVKVLSDSDILLLTEVYDAGEDHIVEADGLALSKAIRLFGKIDPIFINDVSTLPKMIFNLACDGDIVILMGAGSIGKIASQFRELGK